MTHISYQEVRQLIWQQFEPYANGFAYTIKVDFLKPTYYLASWDDIAPMIEEHYLPLRERAPYDLDTYNCVQFSTLFYSIIAFQSYEPETHEDRPPIPMAMCTGYIRSGYHQANLWINERKEVLIIEPQTINVAGTEGLYHIGSQYMQHIDRIYVP